MTLENTRIQADSKGRIHRSCKQCAYLKNKKKEGICGTSGCDNSTINYYCDDCKQKNLERHKIYNDKNREVINQKNLAKYYQERQTFLSMYGGKCQNCGEKGQIFLTLDHINGDGNIHRRNGGQRKILREVIKEYRPDLYQILCFNCQFIQAKENGFMGRGLSLIKSHYLTQNQKYYLNIKKTFFDMYGPKCVCCDYSDIRAISLDHVNGDGKGDHGMKAYIRAIKYFNPESFQVLCMNCNCAKRNNTTCPHKHLIIKEL